MICSKCRLECRLTRRVEGRAQYRCPRGKQDYDHNGKPIEPEKEKNNDGNA